ncbi:hypothetical protein LASUN_10780 [Lentilactobacillus sunkii]|jgi:hypothetical protein|uniref:Uncharacterized protein n=1 Tax=Lentilactobacillus sunkii TaxID=481719 RepID=A0A1E7XD78_9LACO|nr:hypothetical protein LASUN_10780 [Lentilactobacillus sunkii]
MESVISSSNENPGQIQILQDSTHIFNRHSAIDIATYIIFHDTDWSSPYIQAGIHN